MSIDGNGRRVACDPYTGSVEAVLECARNLACVGAEPLGLTNCLNFGNPEKGHIAWQLTRSVEGLRDACLALGVPVVGGNVSLYNEGGEGPIYPTPIVGMVGQAARSGARAAGRLCRRGPRGRARGTVRPGARRARSSRSCGGACRARCRRWTSMSRHARWPRCARPCAPATCPPCTTSREGGLLVAIAECCIEGGLGAHIELAAVDEVDLFGEGPGGAVIAGPADAVGAVPGAQMIGSVEGDALEVQGALTLSVGRAA